MSAQFDKLRDVLRGILELVQGDWNVPDELIKPMRIYINDLERFNSPVIYLSKFKNFLEARDANQIDGVVKDHQLEADKLRETQNEINKLLDQILSLLNESTEQDDNLGQRLQAVVNSVKKARSLTQLNDLGNEMMAVGKEMIAQQEANRQRLDKLTHELTISRQMIDELQNELETRREEAEKDHLTDLFNRRMFDRDLLTAIDRANRFQTPVCLLLLDLDHFKEINDTYGHAIGDDVLINFAKLLKSSLRDNDLTYRIGGDEFAVLFNNSNMEQALAVANRVRDFVSNNSYKTKGASFKLYLSAGLAEFKAGENHDSFYKRTDKFLYAAKKGGRNQVISELELN